VFLPKTVIHAIYMLYYLSRQDLEALAPSSAISRSRAVPPEHAHKILQALRAAGLVASVCRRSGGHRLTKNLEDISVLEVSDALAPPSDSHNLEPRDCAEAPGELCRVHDGLVGLHDDVRKFLARRTVASLICGQCRAAIRPAGTDRGRWEHPTAIGHSHPEESQKGKATSQANPSFYSTRSL